MDTPSQFQAIMNKRDRDVGIRDISEPKTIGVYNTMSIVAALLITSQWLVFIAVHDEGASPWRYWIEPLTVPLLANIAAFAKGNDFPSGLWMAIYLLNPLLILAQDKRFPMKMWAVAGALSIGAGAIFAPAMATPYAVVQAFIVWFLAQVMATQFIRLSKTFKIVAHDRVAAGCCLFGSLILMVVGVTDIANYVLPLVAGICLGIWMWFYRPAEKV
ncbi:hypothetical protein PQU92_01595 [Asticcacaulis sp. BYS171W]|uniref:Uncharacterized protein n=1 Tax=Asticcacaulis aquaticus TaxID=2984212 RepID=A0ABT5HR82_9CAUL|nr:hypothetical protein [Asticcacaulis aquaticus]MDC7681951.1 hypothetical protein [Asticcacaulis aquaticus]